MTDFLLIPGLWLDGSAWDGVVTPLEDDGHRVVAMTLPGQGDDAATATYDEQVQAVLSAVDDATAPVVVVGHSAAATLAWVAADKRPEHVTAVVLVGGHPMSDGDAYADFFDADGDEVPFPGWDAFEGADADDLDEDVKRRFAAAAHPVPTSVTTGTVQLHDERRYDVPVVLVCPEFTPEDAQEWLDAGHMPELARVDELRLVNIESGHWPMLTRPGEMATLLAEIADELA